MQQTETSEAFPVVLKRLGYAITSSDEVRLVQAWPESSSGSTSTTTMNHRTNGRRNSKQTKR
ncbi:hypothetical protein OUZ56_008785 [Daphnia magna]|uniref:Uncharacterized protein n=1 Tax=Daphnia magna TaxID=35525 RepID=A0ABR0AE20_9CRUS|nr:hypothetical protein OUZ56_008785 [Daphnia magna]